MATYRNIKVRKPNGGFRTQRAMVLASGKLKFVSNKHRSGGAAAPQKARHVARKSKSKSITKSKRRYHLAKMPRRRRGGRGGGMNLLHLGGAALALAYATQNVKTVSDAANKIPGAKTFGAPAAIGIACLAADRFVKPNKWLKLAGAAGIVLAATQIGKQGTNFKWVGDGDDFTADVGDDDDVADYDDVGDDEG